MNNTIEVLELYLKMSDGYFRADVKTAIKQVIATIKALKRERVDVEGNCYYCNKLVNNLAGNPSEWGIPLCHSDEPGKVKPHHIGCVSDRLEVLESAGDELPEKKEIPDGATDGRVRYGTSQFNYCLDLCQIVLAKQILKVKELKADRDNWLYELAYYSKEELEEGTCPTPKGVKKFVEELLVKVKEAQSITAHEIEGTTEYKCEHKGTLDGDCVWCALSVAETGLDKQRAKVKELEAKIKEIENG